MPLDEWIKLNVGGKPFLTTLGTLLSYPDSLLAKMFDPESGFQPPYSEDGVYFLNADPMYFGIILNWLRYRKVMAPSDTNAANLAHIADYYGIVDLVEVLPLPPVGRWMDEADVAPGKLVNGMWLTVSKVFGPCAQIIQLPNGKLSVVMGDVNMTPGTKCLTSDAKGRSVWVPTEAGRLPPGAIGFEGKEGEKNYIGRKVWVTDETNKESALPLQVFHTEGGVPIIPDRAIISVGYVNEEGIWDINFSEYVDTILEQSSEAYDYRMMMIDQGLIEDVGFTCTTSHFEVLCIF